MKSVLRPKIRYLMSFQNMYQYIMDTVIEIVYVLFTCPGSNSSYFDHAVGILKRIGYLHVCKLQASISFLNCLPKGC